MERLRLERGCFRTGGSTPVYLIGANYWPSRTGPFMYRETWRPKDVAADLDDMASLGVNAVRLFCFWPDFMKMANAVEDPPLSRLAETVDLAAARALYVLPTFFVGHMSGENFDPPWRSGADMYADEKMLAAQELMIEIVVGRLRDRDNVAAWVLTNEWPLYAGDTHERTGSAWAARMCKAVRKADPRRPVSLGDGAWDVVWGHRNGLKSAQVSGVVDFFGPHFYPKETDGFRHSLVAPFSVRMLQPFGKPVLLEEFGCSSDQVSDDNAAAYYRTTLWSAYGAGGCGALAWNSHDFDLPWRAPYSHHPYELHFGLLRNDGSPKPQAAEFARFARFATRHDDDEWEPVSPSAAIARTPYFLRDYPFDWGWSKTELRDLYLAAYALGVRAGVDLGFVDLDRAPDEHADRERRPAALETDARVLFVPCLQQVTTQAAAQLEGFVEGGGTVYVSHGCEPWSGAIHRLLGVRPRIRYGLVESPAVSASLTFAAPAGGISANETVHVAVKGHARRVAHLDVEPTAARVLATDGGGRPALTARKIGSGNAVFCAYPIEYYATHETSAADESWRIYRAVADLAGATVPTAGAGVPSIDHPSVQTFAWHSRRRAGFYRVVAVNHAWEPVSAHLLPAAAAGADLEDGSTLAAGGVVHFGPKAVRVVQLQA